MSPLTRVFYRTAINHQSKHLRPINKPLYNFVTSSRGFRTTVANMGVHNIASKAEYQEKLKESKESGKILVLDAFATWCGPCKVIAPTVAQWSEKDFAHVSFVKLDVDEVSDVAQELGIRAMPTFIIYKDGEEVKQVVGANPVALKNWISQYAGEKPAE